MTEIFEITDREHIDRLTQEFKLDVSPLDRAFVMQENGDIGLGVLGLEKGAVIVKDVYVKHGFPFEYYDLLARALLGIIRDFSPIKVRIKGYKEYFERFGFVKAGGEMEAMSDRIMLGAKCAIHN